MSGIRFLPSQAIGAITAVVARASDRFTAARPINLDRTLGTLTQTTEALGRTIDELARTITTQSDAERVTAVDGPFAGDPDAAAQAATLWLATGTHRLDELKLAIINAHIATGGLAANHPPSKRRH